MRIAIIVVIIVALIFFFGFAVPYLTTDHTTRYLSESDLETAVDIDELSTTEYVYHGIAEHHKTIELFGRTVRDKVDYRVKYEAHIRANYTLSDIKFKIDEETKTVTAYLPEAELDKPQLIQSEFDYLPENASADMKDVLSICRDDASNDINKDEIKEEANISLQNTVKALILPMLGDDEYTVEFKTLAEYDDDNAAVESDVDDAAAGEDGGSAQGSNEGNGEGESNE